MKSELLIYKINVTFYPIAHVCKPHLEWEISVYFFNLYPQLSVEKYKYLFLSDLGHYFDWVIYASLNDLC